MARTKKRIVVLGGGFAGLECTRKLESHFKNNSEIEIILVSEDNFLLFTPMLPQVASGMIETRHIVMPIRTLCDKAIFYESIVKNIDPHGKIVTLMGTSEKRGISLHYDYLVIALGSQTNFFGMNDVQENAYTMKTLNDAVMLRNRIIDMLEQAENETNPILQKSMLTFVIVGGGFAGIETAGEVMDFLVDATKHYPKIEKQDIHVIVLEALSSILPGFSEKLARFANEKLIQRGIDIKLKMAVTSFDGTEVIVKKLSETKKDSIDESEKNSIQTKTVVWTAGVRPTDTIQNSIFKTNKGKIIVNEFLEVVDWPGVFAIGDCCQVVTSNENKSQPPTAQVAEAQAKTAAHNLHSLITKNEKVKYDYEFKGQMAIIGKRTGIASVFGINVHGFLAWWLWRNYYLSKMPKFDKRFRVMLDWFVDLFFDRDISRLKFLKKETTKEYKELDEVDDVW
jgi:NADH:ubiquinone reductase (H+-translocating)